MYFIHKQDYCKNNVIFGPRQLNAISYRGIMALDRLVMISFQDHTVLLKDKTAFVSYNIILCTSQQNGAQIVAELLVL